MRILLPLALLLLSATPLRAAVTPGAGSPGGSSVLLLHSYHAGFAWTDKLTRGVSRALADSGRDVSLAIEYMDTKRRSDETHYENLFWLMNGKFPPRHFDVVITADDEALIFALRYRDELFPGVPIVFCGSSSPHGALLAAHRALTGIVETQDIRRTMGLAARLHPGTTRIVVINDRTTTGLSRQEQVERAAADLAGQVRVETLPDLTGAELARRLAALGPQDVVFLQSFNRDREGRVYDQAHLMTLIGASCARPVYSCNEEYLGLGIVGGYLTAGEALGAEAARLALRILAGERAEAIPVLTEGANVPMFDAALLRRYSVPRRLLPEGSILVNRRPSFYREHRSLVWATTVSFGALLAVILVLSASITRRRAMERALREREEDLATTLHSIGDAVIATDAAGRVVRLNAVACRLTGWEAADAVGRPIGEVLRIVHAETRAPMDAQFARVFAEGRMLSLAETTLLIARDGKERRIADSAAPIRDPAGMIRGLVVVFRDISEKLLLEAQFRQSQKLETVGRLAGGVAHDFNNLLGGIIGYAELIARDLPADAPPRRYAGAIIETAERAAELTRNLLAFSRKGGWQRQAVDVNRTVREVVEILRQTGDRRVSLTARLAPGEALVEGDPAQLQNALMNLGVNAREATPEGGTVTFTTAEVALDEPACRALPDPVSPGPCVQVTVEDTGQGMTPEVMEHLFEPFFSTKEGQGTGLGLAAVYGTVRAHRGTIVVESAPGRGCAFRVLLPRAVRDPGEDAPPAAGV